MSQTVTKILTLLLGLILLTTGVSAVPIYQIGTEYLSEDTINGGYYILNGTNLTLPLNITYIDGDKALTRLEVNTTISQNSVRVPDLDYKYKFAFGGQHGSIDGSEWIYQFAGGSSSTLKGIQSEALVLNITNLQYNQNKYDVAMKVYAGSGNTDYDIQTVTLGNGVNVYYLYPGTTETNEAGSPKWNITNPLNVTSIILKGELTANTYTIPWETHCVSRGNDVFSLLITPDNTNASVWKLSGGNWIKADGSKIESMNVADKTLTIKIGDNDVNCESYMVVFEGKVIGDVSDLYPTASDRVNIADVDMILHFNVANEDTQSDYISENRCVYADVDNNGIINGNDASIVYSYTQLNVDQSV